MYVCGPTVYDDAHIGNARPAVVFDVLVRVLERHFGGVIYARNLTDVDDKINAAAAAGVPISVIAERFTAAYHADMAALGVRAPGIEPRVTDHIPQIIDLILRLLAAGQPIRPPVMCSIMCPPLPITGCSRAASAMR